MKHHALRRLCTVLAVACLLGPAWSYAGRVILHFVADFDQGGDPGTGNAPIFLAKGGTFTIQGPPNVFNVVVDGAGNGVLLIGENSFSSPGILTGVLDTPSYDSTIDIDLTMIPAGSITDAVISLVDDNGGGMIDLELDEEDGGKLTVDGMSIQLGSGGEGAGPLAPIGLSLRLNGTMLGVNTWQLIVSGSFGTQQLSGLLPLVGPLSLAKIKFVRPGLTQGGTWAVDDLVISSPYDQGMVSQ